MCDKNHDIPSAEAIHQSKLHDVVITTDTCNAECILSSLMKEAVTEVLGEKIHNDGGIPEDEQTHVYIQDCHNYMRNVWVGAVNQ